MSGGKAREERREQRLREESEAEGQERRQRLLKLAAAAAFVVVIAVAVAIVVSQNQGGGGSTNLVEIGQVDSLLKGIPQEGAMLGDPKAKASLYEYGDLQCPICKEYSEQVLPQLIDRPGPQRRGQSRIPQLHDHRHAVSALWRRSARRRQAGSRLELHRALLPKPGPRGLRLRHRLLPDHDRQGRRGQGPRQVERRPQEQAHRGEVASTTAQAEGSASPARRPSRSKARTPTV